MGVWNVIPRGIPSLHVNAEPSPKSRISLVRLELEHF